MDKGDECYTTNLIDGAGKFNADGLDKFIKQVKLGESGNSYVVVSVMGPQSSGKSTLLNHLFHTNFKEMNAQLGRTQTTLGIWLARCTGIKPCTIVMDIEGTDGQERGEDDTTFEKQTALFAMAVSHVVIINMWNNDIGRENAANKPLLRIVFQHMLRLFSPRKTTLMFIIRDKSKYTPLEVLDKSLRKEINKIWDSVRKPEHGDLSQFFNVEVVGLSSYEEKEEQFKEEVASLRQKFLQSVAPGGIASDRRGVVPASGFSLSSNKIWEQIKQNKDLQMPKLTHMVAKIRCEEIANEKYSSFIANKDWRKLEEDVKSHLVPGFGKKLSLLLDNCLSKYNEEATHFDGNVVSERKNQLSEKLMQLVQPAYKQTIEHIRSETLNSFKIAFTSTLNEGYGFAATARYCTNQSTKRFKELCEDATIKQANWDSTKIRDQFFHDMELHITKVRAAKLHELPTQYESMFEEALSRPVDALLELGSDDTWPRIRMHLHGETKKIVSWLSSVLSSFEINEQDKNDMISKLKNYATTIIERKAKYEAGKVLGRMKERFAFIFNHDHNSMPRVSWTGKEDIPAITKIARYYSLKLLSVLAAIRLDEKMSDTIWETLAPLLETDASSSQDPLTSTTWEKVPAANTLITPVQCKSLWNQFLRETEYIIAQALASQKPADTYSSNPWRVFVKDLVTGLATPVGLALSVADLVLNGGTN